VTNMDEAHRLGAPSMTRQEQLATELRAWADWCESSVDTVDARPARPHHVVLREAAAILDFPSIVEDGPHFDEHFRKKIDVYADKHPTAVVRQLATRLRAAWAALAQAAPQQPGQSVEALAFVGYWDNDERFGETIEAYLQQRHENAELDGYMEIGEEFVVTATYTLDEIWRVTNDIPWAAARKAPAAKVGQQEGA
jgi:hypothetical protein